MYRNLNCDRRQNVYVMTKSMPKEEVISYFNTELYNPMIGDYVNGQATKEDPLAQILNGLITSGNDPVLIECGPVVMSKYFESVRNGDSKNLIDGAYIAFFEGNLSQEFIGN